MAKKKLTSGFYILQPGYEPGGRLALDAAYRFGGVRIFKSASAARKYRRLQIKEMKGSSDTRYFEELHVVHLKKAPPGFHVEPTVPVRGIKRTGMSSLYYGWLEKKPSKKVRIERLHKSAGKYYRFRKEEDY